MVSLLFSVSWQELATGETICEESLEAIFVIIFVGTMHPQIGVHFYKKYFYSRISIHHPCTLTKGIHQPLSSLSAVFNFRGWTVKERIFHLSLRLIATCDMAAKKCPTYLSAETAWREMLTSLSGVKSVKSISNTQ